MYRLKNISLSLLSTLIVTIMVAVSCQSEEILHDAQSQLGTIELSLTSDPELQIVTRAEQPLTDITRYTFTIQGTKADGTAVDATITPQQSNSSFSAVFEAGTYILTAASKASQDEAPWYHGETKSFTLNAGEARSVTLSLGKPQNAEISVIFDDSFTDLYENYRLSVGNKSIDANSATNKLYIMPTEEGITYTIHATAKEESHAQEIPSTGVSGTLTVAAGCSYPLTIKASPVTGIIIPLANGTHSGAFNVKPRR